MNKSKYGTIANELLGSEALYSKSWSTFEKVHKLQSTINMPRSKAPKSKGASPNHAKCPPKILPFRWSSGLLSKRNLNLKKTTASVNQPGVYMYHNHISDLHLPIYTFHHFFCITEVFLLRKRHTNFQPLNTSTTETREVNTPISRSKGKLLTSSEIEAMFCLDL